MSLASAAPSPPTDRRRAYSAGVVAGMITLAVGWLVLAQAGFPGVADASSGFALDTGDCVRLADDDPSALQAVDCSLPHDGEVVGLATHPDSGRPFPGDDVTRVWFEQSCQAVTTDYLGADHLTTTLDAPIVVPSERDWDDGVHHATCYVTVGEGSDPLTGSVKGRADDFARGDIVAIDRLMPGDCFDPAGSSDPFGLRSGDVVELVDCSGSFAGLFFGRGNLPYPDDAPIPSDNELTDESTSTCSAAFESFFGVESAVGYTFRFWRPSRSRWEDGDREVLCAVLSDRPIDGPFVPADYPELHKLGTGQCFGLLPEQTAESLTLDDHVRPIRCSQPHRGQMIGGGTFDADLRFPGDAQARALTEQECRSLFLAFIGIEPGESEFGRFPYWYPNEDAWADDDTRYACAILDEDLTGSLQGSRR
ncbi:MAG: septum formation family protein [Acidimicrobiia bacterium]|nr:septum formation family protein [Acidimicrobiia bacterium]